MTEPLELISLGGCGGFGMNATLLACGGDALLIDFGLGFPTDNGGGAFRTAPNPTPLLQRWPALHGVLLTHGHDDHVAGLPFLPLAWRRAPHFGLPLTLRFARDRFEGRSLAAPVMTAVQPRSPLTLGPFCVRWLPVTHSIPHSAMLAIDTPSGTVLHSGDFKFDRAPVRGPTTDMEALDQIGAAGVRLLLVDSTGARRPGWTASESAVRAPLRRAIGGARRQVFASTFASHLHRIQTLIEVAAECGRKAILLGMRARTTVRHGIDLGLLDAPAGLVVSPEDAQQLAPEQRLYLCGGCQGESDSALARLSYGTDGRAEATVGDLVLIAASIVPGNEVPVARLIDRFLRRGCLVEHAAEQRELHASGHASRDELAELIARTRPQAVLPIHGDRAHLLACQQLALEQPVPPRQVPLVELGETLLVSAEAVALGARYELPPLLLDDTDRTIDLETRAERRQMAASGTLVVHVVRRRTDVDVRLRSAGLIDGHEPALRRTIEDLVQQIVAREATRMTRRELEQEIARRVAGVARRGARYRPAVIAMLDEAREG